MRIALMVIFLCGALTAAHGQETEPAYEPGFHEVSLEVVTPHLPFARPLAGGPIKALFIAPRACHRDTAELAQRLDLDYRVVMTFTRDRLGGIAAIAHTHIIGGMPDDVERELLTKLKQRYDCIVVGNLHFDILPMEVQYAILRQVYDGVGLLLTHHQAGRGEYLQRAIDFEASKDDPAEVAAGVPLTALPQWANVKSDEEAARKAVTLRTFQRGRICLLNLGRTRRTNYLTPLTTGITWVEEDEYLSLVAKAILWCARRDRPVRLAAVSLQPPAGEGSVVPRGVLGQAKIAARMVSQGGPPRAQAELVVRSESGEELLRKQAEVKVPRQAEATFELAPLPVGKYFADVIVRRGKAVLDWGAISFTVTAPVTWAELACDREYVKPGEEYRLTATLSAPAPGEMLATAVCADCYGRELFRAQKKLADGAKQVSFASRLVDPVGNLLVARVRLVQGGQTVDEQRLEIPVRLLLPEGDFSFLMWGCGGDELARRYVYEQLVAQGVDTVNHGTPEVLARYGLHGLAGIRAGLHFNERKEENNIRSPCFTDPQHLAKVRERLLGVAQSHVKYGGTGYTLGDDNILGVGDICFSPTCLTDLRRELKGIYGTLEALNAEWGTKFAAWDEVRPTTLAEARKTKQYARWCDHRMHMESVWAGIHRFAREVVESVDPGAPVGSDAACGRGSFGGYDWWKLSNIMTLWNVYPSPVQVELLRSFHHPKAYTGLWFGGYLRQRYNAYQRWLPWYTISRGLSAAWWFKDYSGCTETCQEDAIAPDLRPFECFATSAREVREIKRGFGRLLLGAERESDGIAVLYSQASIHAATLFPTFGTVDAAMGGVIRLLADAGFQYHFISYEQLASGILKERGYRALVLPLSQALSPAEKQAVGELVRAGGVVIADLRPGVLDGHCKPDDDAAWRGLWGVQSFGAEPERMSALDAEIKLPGGQAVTLKGLSADGSLKAGAARAGGTAAEAPLLLTHAAGEGLTALLNFPFASYQRKNSVGAAWQTLLRDLLAQRGIQPRVHLALKPAPADCEVLLYRDGPAEYIALLAGPNSEADRYEGTVKLPERRRLYDCRAGKALGRTDTLQVKIGRGEARLFAALPYEVQKLELSGTTGCRAGQPVRLHVRLRADRAPGRHVVHLSVADPEGHEKAYLARNVELRGGVAEARIPTALNDAAGRWMVTARDIATGARATKRYELTAAKEATP